MAPKPQRHLAPTPCPCRGGWGPKLSSTPPPPPPPPPKPAGNMVQAVVVQFAAVGTVSQPRQVNIAPLQLPSPPPPLWEHIQEQGASGHLRKHRAAL